MAATFDPTLKDLVEAYPAQWLAALGLPVQAPVRVINANLSAFTADADKVIRVGRRSPWLAHVELQAGRDRHLARRTFRYNVLLYERHALPVLSVLVLLRPEADGAELTGHLMYEPMLGRGRVDFRYEVVRVWQEPTAKFLHGGPGLMPLAPVAAVTASELPRLVLQMRDELRSVEQSGVRAKVWAATYIMMGLRYHRAFIDQLLEGVMDMEESVTYQYILAKGRTQGKTEGQIEEAQRMVLRLGTKLWGAPPARSRQRLLKVQDLKQLEALSERILDVGSWKELLALLQE